MIHNLIKALCILLLSSSLVGAQDSPDSVPPGDPAFPSFTGNWVVDQTGSVSLEFIAEANRIFGQLQTEGVAEIFVLIINEVNHPEQYATRLGRHLKLGHEDLDNGLVYLIRPNAPANQRIIYSVGRGLTGFTSQKVTEATSRASTLANEGRFSLALQALAGDTYSILRQLDEDGSLNQNEIEEGSGTIVGVIIFVLLAAAACIALSIIDGELGYLCIRIMIALLSSSTQSTGGSGKFGGRSGSR